MFENNTENQPKATAPGITQTTTPVGQLPTAPPSYFSDPNYNVLVITEKLLQEKIKATREETARIKAATAALIQEKSTYAERAISPTSASEVTSLKLQLMEKDLQISELQNTEAKWQQENKQLKERVKLLETQLKSFQQLSKQTASLLESDSDHAEIQSQSQTDSNPSSTHSSPSLHSQSVKNSNRG